MSKTLPPSVFASSRLSPHQPSKSPLSVSNTTLVAKTPFLIDDILHQHHTPTHNYKNAISALNFVSAKPSGGLNNNCSYLTANSAIGARNTYGNNKSANKSSNDLADDERAVGNSKESGRSMDDSIGIFHEAEQLMIRNVEEDYRRQIER